MTIKNADMPAIPMNGESIDTLESWSELTAGGRIIPVRGLSKREMMAMHIAAGLISGHQVKTHQVAEDAVRVADLLLAELERTK